MRRTPNNSGLTEGRVVLVAYNLHKKCFSVRLASSKKVVGYSDRIILTDVCFPVQNSGRLRVLVERKKNVHAFVKGVINNSRLLPPFNQMREAYYNPYLVEGFVDRETMEIIKSADIALCENGKVYYHVWMSE